MEQNTVWFHAVGAEKVGPLSFDGMVALLRAGRIDGETKIWNAGLDGWRPLREVEAFAAALAEVTPPPLEEVTALSVEPPSAAMAAPVPAAPPPVPSALAPSPAAPVFGATDSRAWACLVAVLLFALAVLWFGWQIVALVQADASHQPNVKPALLAAVRSLIWLDPVPALAAQLVLFAVAARLSLGLLRRRAQHLQAAGRDSVSPQAIGRVWFVSPGLLWRPPGLVATLLDETTGRPSTARNWLVRVWWLFFGLATLLFAATIFLAIRAYLEPPVPKGSWIDTQRIAAGGALGFALMNQIGLLIAALLWAVIVARLGQVRLALPRTGSGGAVGGASGMQPARFAGLGRLPRPVLVGAGVLVVALIGWLALDGGGPKGPPPSWKKTVSRDPVTDAQITRLIGYPAKVNGVMGRAPAFTISCGSRGVGLGVDFGLALQDAFPQGSADIVRVTVRADQGTPQVLAFLPSNDWNSAFAIDQSSVGAGMTSLAVDIFGGLLPNARDLNTRWKAIDLVRMMAGSKQFVLRAPTRTGTDITLTFEMASYNRLLAELPPQCR